MSKIHYSYNYKMLILILITKSQDLVDFFTSTPYIMVGVQKLDHFNVTVHLKPLSMCYCRLSYDIMNPLDI